ncbi:PREDICTED: general odorant-binding protein 84a-like isoform X1 [Rhagoletis zephyria]|uniref:general odorant-binding protein 84a-like isoform X1 n=1 Tax=Rhagoletis zephyria TaxID=28612 RepID=UPI0008118C5F|nr:PREDICTED: general odorant-binding protein 84a-like isoform X1 [Rhagoletis zephyria]
MVNHQLGMTLSVLLFLATSLANAQTNSMNNRLDVQPSMETKTTMAENPSAMGFDFEAAVRTCNASFPTPIEYIQQFNETAELPNTADKTSMCFMHCYMEKTGLMRNWQLNRALIMQTMWPATGDSIPVCQNEGSRKLVLVSVRTPSLNV